ncbi:unnamed protein product, partial [Staurois parvus]
FDPDFSDHPLLTVPPTYLLIRHIGVETLCTCSVWCVLLESACDQPRANHHCPERGQGFYILLEQKENASYKL